MPTATRKIVIAIVLTVAAAICCLLFFVNLISGEVLNGFIWVGAAMMAIFLAALALVAGQSSSETNDDDREADEAS